MHLLPILISPSPKKALVMVPVADLIGNPVGTFGIDSSIKDAYTQFSLSGGPGNSSLQCPRIHQLLCNETVDIIADYQNEVCIRITSSFFITHDNPQPQTLYWTLKSNLISYEKLQKKNLPLALIPSSPDFKHPDIQSSEHVVALLLPFYDPVTHQTFSAGTRFVYDPQKSTAQQHIVWIFDHTTTTFKTTTIPVNVLVTIKPKEKKVALNDFVHILRQWAHQSNGVIPYVWGGCSFIHLCKDNIVQLEPIQSPAPMSLALYHRSDCLNKPYTGFDCAGIISRAAQLAGIPFFYKNTYTIAHYLKPVTSHSTIKEGDIIWIPGHVMIVSSLLPALLIEARGYPHGYGIVHEISLEKVFKGIKTFAQLSQAHHKQKMIIRLNKAGYDMEKIKKFKILSMESIWESYPLTTSSPPLIPLDGMPNLGIRSHVASRKRHHSSAHFL